MVKIMYYVAQCKHTGFLAKYSISVTTYKYLEFSRELIGLSKKRDCLWANISYNLKLFEFKNYFKSRLVWELLELNFSDYLSLSLSLGVRLTMP